MYRYELLRILPIADLADASLELVTLIEHDKNVLRLFRLGNGILEISEINNDIYCTLKRILIVKTNLEEMSGWSLKQEHVTAACAPQQTFEPKHAARWDNASHVPDGSFS